MPVKYCDLPLSSQLAITVWDLAGPGRPVPFGGTTVALFEKDKYVLGHCSRTLPLANAVWVLVTSRKVDRSVRSGLELKLMA